MSDLNEQLPPDAIEVTNQQIAEILAEFDAPDDEDRYRLVLSIEGPGVPPGEACAKVTLSPDELDSLRPAIGCLIEAVSAIGAC